MKKRLYFLGILFVSVILLCLVIYNIGTNQIHTKISLLEDAFSQNDEMKALEKKQNEYIAIISISDNKTPAIVKWKKDASIKKAYESVKDEVSKYIKDNEHNTELIKIDFVKDLEEMSMEDFEDELQSLEKEYMFRHGIILSYENGEEIVLTEGELNSNYIIDYDDCEIDLKDLNDYLTKCNQKKVSELPTQVKTFSTISYFCDHENNIYEMDADTGHRKLELNSENVKGILNNATNYLFNLVEDNGKYIYGYSPLKNKENKSYNILRHAGSTWALIIEHDSSDEQRQKIDNSLKYLVSTVQYFDNETAYVQELKNGELKLGGNALSIIAMCEYIEKFNNTQYLELVGKLGNGIIKMQNEDGSYVHVLNADDYSLKNEYRTVYYDGEATFALAKLYGVTKNEKYLEAAQKAIQYFIENNYTKYGDHWISYAVNEILKHVDNEEYYEFGLMNIGMNLDDIANKPYTSHTNFEMLLQGFELYEKILEKNMDLKYLDEFPVKKFFEVLNNKAHFQLNSYLFPEIAMYLKVPEKYSNTFYIRHADYRIRIDDIQHSILGYHYYYKNLENLEKYQNEL